MRTDDFLSLNNISDPEYVRICAIHGIDPSLDVLKAGDQELILESLTQPSAQSTAGKPFTPKTKADRLDPRMTTKCDLCCILNISVEEFEAHCKKSSLVIEDSYNQAQVGYYRDRLGAKARATEQSTAVQPTDLNQVAQSEAMTIRESVNLSAGTGTRALQALSTQRDNTQQAIAAEIERLTNPELFFTETIAIAAEKIRSREQQREQVSFELDFFDVASVTASLPAPRPLPQVQTVKSLSAG